MNIDSTHTTNPLNISGSYDFPREELELVFTENAGPDVQQLFYKIFNDKAWKSAKISGQYALYADLAQRVEAAQQAAQMNPTGTIEPR